MHKQIEKKDGEEMIMGKLYEALRTQFAMQHPGYGDDSQSVLEMLYNVYNECNGVDNNEIQQDFKDIYEAMYGKTLREKDRVIDAVCRLYRDHENAASRTESAWASAWHKM